MSRVSRFVTSRITLAVIGVVLVGGAGGLWAATGGPHLPGQVASTSSSTGSSTSTVTNPGDATATPNDGVSPTATVARPAPTQAPRPTATPCPGAPSPQLHVQGSVESVGASSFVFSTTCFHPLTIQVNGSTQWPGTAKAISQLQPRWHAEIVANQTTSPNTYLATIVDAQPDN